VEKCRRSTTVVQNSLTKHILSTNIKKSQENHIKVFKQQEIHAFEVNHSPTVKVMWKMIDDF